MEECERRRNGKARARGWPPALLSPERRRPPRSTSGRAGSAPARAQPPPAAPRSRPPAAGSAARHGTARHGGGCPGRGAGGCSAAGVTAGGSCPYTCTTNTYTNRTYTSSSDSIHGDPHYNTFDKQRHDFMGTCTYTLSKLCDSNSSLPYFNVEAANEHRGGNTRVSYVRYVDVDVYGYRINLGQKRAVKVNGVSQVVPVTLVPGVSISLSGQYVVVTTDFGLQVKFDGNHRAEIALPSTYMSKVCGICGNYNGQKADDFLNPDGEMEANSTSLGNSWQVNNDSSCSPDYGHTPNCTDDEKHMIQTLACAANSHYEPCAAACPATCVDPTAPYNCSLPCVEGCVCDSGYLLYNDRCVPSQQCGCWHNGQHYPVGSEFWTDNTCSSKCTCPARGSKVQCFNASCPAGQYCGVQNGKPVCLEHSYGICHVHGDPHYQTFDKVTHDFMGNCTYTLAKVCSNTTSLPYFNVEAKNEHRGSTRVSYVREVVVEVYGQRIVIVKQQTSHVLVNNVRQTLPVSAAGGAIRVSKSGRYIVLETDFSLRVSYDADHSVEVKVPTTYFNLTCGMCGNFNNRRDDEYMMPNGQQAADSNALGESWQVPDSDPSCGVPVPSPPCSAEEEKLYRSDQFCGLLTTRPSSFESCHGVINPQDYFDTCLYDLCALNGGQEFLCAALEAYADACQAAGVTLLPWRNATFCPVACSPNSHYNPCTSACPATCTDPLASQNCSRPCVEGCECNSGFVLSGGQCVSMSNCGCLQNGKYYEVNGDRVHLPVDFNHEARISIRRHYIVIDTSLGIQVKFDGDQELFILVDESLKGQLCGLCGTFNDNQQDDFLNPDKVLEQDPNKFGDSWIVKDDNRTCNQVSVVPPACDTEKEKEYEELCKIILKTGGPFQVCHSHIPPQLYFESCVYDLCATEGDSDQYCKILEAYAAACEAEGVNLGEWREDTICAAPPACNMSCTFEADFCEWKQETNDDFDWIRHKGPTPTPNTGPSHDHTTGEGYYIYLQGSMQKPADVARLIVLEGMIGEDLQSDVALDDLSIVKGQCTGTCVVEGDPHYHTFDKQLHNFMGTCTYTLSKLCDSNSSLPYFNVEAANEHRGGNTRVSYVRYVDVDVADQRIRLGQAGVVTVNGVEEILPCSPSEGVEVLSSGFYTMVMTDFGLRVKFDGKHRVEVTLPSAFGQKVCGMCGNYNGIAADDFQNPEGTMEPDSTSLGNSWEVSNNSSCSAGPLPTPACNETDKQLIGSSHFCGLLNDTSGPFQVCHAVLSPSSYFDTCSYDLCELGLDHETLCNSLQSYADACQSLGVQIPVWRNATFCPIACPANSHYEPCAAACPATCVDPMAPVTCSLPCVEGCVCDSGYLLYNDRCVPSQQCGCWHNGQHYPVGSEFWTDNTCSSKCTCPARGSKVQCFNASCPAGQYCGVQNGKPVCLEHSYGICHVHGDPHYQTFDKVTHDFMGNCTYTLAKVCSNTTSLPYFNVEAKNEHRGSTRVSYVREVVVEVYGQRIVIVKQQTSHVLVNNVRQTLPVSAAGGAIRVSKSGRYIVLETDFSLRVSYDADHSVEVKVPTTYFNLTCGMCGNFNNRRDDEYMMPNGQQAADSNALGESWQVPDSDPSCGVPVPSPPCSAEEEKLYRSDQFCGLLTTRPSSFESCHGVINPQDYFDTCLYDLCALNGGQEFLCAALEAYADACQAAGVTLLPWRNATFCPLQCPLNSYYDPCMTGCPATCVDQQAPQNCSKPCVEGCACSSGFLLSGDTCVPEANCGCHFEGNYYTQGESFVNENCTRRCRCEGKGQMVCSALSCGEDEVCKIQDGQRGCYPASTAVCHIYGDPHYSTFDGKLHHFQGSCNYTVVTGCDNSSVGFTVTTRNKHRGSQSWTALNSVALSLKGLHIALREHKAVYINGAVVSLPASPAPGVTISLSGSYVRVSTKLGLQLQFNGDHELLVKVSEKYKGKLCGLCGTYTGSQQDDFMRPDGVVVPDFNDFGTSWMVPDDEWLHYNATSTYNNITVTWNKHRHALDVHGSPPTDCNFACTFEEDFCGWVQADYSSIDWIRNKGPTPTPNTGPSSDHTTGDGYYIFLQGRADTLAGFVAHLLSPVCSWEGTLCFRFWYHMYGTAQTMTLRVYVQKGEEQVMVWEEVGNHGDRWHLGEVTVHTTGNMLILLEGEWGEDVRSNIALDDLSVVQGACPGPLPTTPPTLLPNVTTPSTPRPTTTPGTTSGTCVVEGDPHYHTFDKQLHNFMGTCTYTLSKLCDSNSSLPYFNVEAANEHRGGNTRVSYVRYVDVDVADQRIRLGQAGVVTVNGVEEILPCSPSEGVEVLSSGFYTMVMTDFGLRVKFDGKHRVEVTLPSAFGQKVCGMCGNYNGIAADDFQNPEGTMEPDSTSLGNSWEVSNNSSCSAGPLPTPACNETDKQLIGSSHFCGLLNDTSGPFQVCHAVLSPSSYFDTCSYDLCELGLDHETLCNSLQSYADACQSLGVQIPVWRNATFCPIACPANSHYEPCAAACPATCVDPTAPYNCSLPCVEGCVCDSGYLLYNDRCVPSQQCGCWHNGQHYPVGSEFWTDNTCSSKCTCPARGSKVQCFNASCPAGQYCGVQNGKPVCLEHSYGICHVHGDPHYQTFDKVTHDFMGNCTYTLAKVCSNTTSLPYFNVEAKNEHRGSTRVSYVREVVVEVYGQRIVIVKQQTSHVLVNNVRQTLPVSAAGGAIRVSKSGRYIVLETDFSLRVSYDADHSVEVKVPTTYFNLTCGMCGNFNNRRDDEYMMPNGQQAADSNALGESWQVPDSDPSCGVPVPSPPCSAEEEKLYRSDQFCGLLTTRPSSFESCHGVINPQDYFDTCLYDLCALNGGQEFLCAALEAYADACQAAGVTLLPWRNATFCPLQCPLNSYYDPCMTGCPATCVDQQAPQNCSKPCVEGCACSSGFLLSGDTCVPEANCGCHFEGNYYTQGESFVNENCTRRCRCEGKGQMVCSALSCGEDEVCKIQDGQRGCYPASTAVCHIYGDPHYSTFDGKLHHFQGSCNYTVVTGCDNSSVGFTVTTRNKHRGSQSWTALNSVALSLKGLHIALREHKAVYINGAVVSLPASPAPGVTISLSGSYVRVSTKLGLQLQFNGDHELLVKVSEKYKGKLCGLCGTYTGSQQDDFMRPDGVVVPDFNDFGTSWMVPDDEWLHYNATSTYNNITVTWNKHRHALDVHGSPPTDCNFACTFEEDFCGWVQADYSSIDWIRNKGPTPTPNTGPSSDHTTGDGYYIFLQGRADTLAGFVAHLLSPVCSWEGTLCFRFWYHMYGTAQTMTLRVYVQKGEEQVMVWEEVGNHGDRWHLGEVTVHTTGNMLILLEGEWGEDVRSNIALDDLSVVQGACPGPLPTTPPTLLPNVTTPSTPRPTTTPGTTSGTCVVEGDPHYHTFDKQLHNFMGTCTYTLSKLCDSNSSLPYFNVEAANKQLIVQQSVLSNPPCRASCSASGDPHYNTFDHKVHNFMGNCTYTLSKVCTASESLPYFDVSTTNEHRGANTKVSYVKSVHVQVYGNQISLLKNKKVNVNGHRMTLPVFIEKKISIQSSGGYVLLETDFGLWVRYDGNHFAEVSVPSNFSGLLCGLCGNYNGDPNDDNIKSNGDIASDSTDLGESWLVPENNTICSSGGKEEQCDPVLESEAKKNTACGMITDPTGIFKDCHSKVPPQNFFENCVYDMCFTGGQATSLCYGLQAYAESCVNAGICIEWRNATLCPMSCPGGSIYKGCGTRCPSTCLNMSAVDSCSSLPVEGCFCKEGYVLSGDKCVTESNCGCVDEKNQYHQLNESWFPRYPCNERCTCRANNTIECISWECGVQEECSIQDGVLGCHSNGQAICQVVGDPHYFTFDGMKYTFVGTCTYTLVEVVNTATKVIPITILGKNEDRGLRGATYLKEVYIDVYGVRITLQKKQGILVHGMCGNFNGNREDDLSLTNGTAVTAPQFGNSWEVEEDSDKGCQCQKNGVISCRSYSCDSRETCVIKDGKHKCNPTGFGRCQVMGDPHYITFDRLVHHFQGKYTYVLAQSTPDLPDTLTPFSIEGVNYPLRGSRHITYLKEMLINVYNHTVRFRQNKQILLDGVRVRPPVRPHEGIRIYQRTTRIYLETDFGLYLSFDGSQNADIKLATTYRGRVEGLCGDFDGRYRNDFKNPDGVWQALPLEVSELSRS
ncbi:IgGFc-binding protein-like [Molothrus aeneus]|uniref:IgGFc-binding protein-like n=1 Tax=Molothrus aeneus TaxID=84833 RepID=UPI0034573E0B